MDHVTHIDLTSQQLNLTLTTNANLGTGQYQVPQYILKIALSVHARIVRFTILFKCTLASVVPFALSAVSLVRTQPAVMIYEVI